MHLSSSLIQGRTSRAVAIEMQLLKCRSFVPSVGSSIFANLAHPAWAES